MREQGLREPDGPIDDLLIELYLVKDTAGAGAHRCARPNRMTGPRVIDLRELAPWPATRRYPTHVQSAVGSATSIASTSSSSEGAALQELRSPLDQRREPLGVLSIVIGNTVPKKRRSNQRPHLPLGTDPVVS